MTGMSEQRACASCGAELEAEAPEGSICEACASAANAVTLPADDRAAHTPSSGSIRSTAQPLYEQIGDFEVLDKLGQGGMGAVYRARQLSLDRLVALKILPSQFEEDETYVTRFQREATVAASLNHPNLVRVFASGEADGCHYIAMELVEGENLRQYLRRTGPLAPGEALRICLGVARGLQHGWQKAQLIHRDIKPSNIYLAANGEAKLGDLGLAKSLLSNTTGVTHTGTAIGTPHYISPEQARGEKTLDPRADIYSLGCTLYELLTGATPYQGSDPMTIMGMHIHSPPPAILKVRPQCPVPLGRIVNKMLRKAKHERHQSYDELIGAMEQALEQIMNPTMASGPSAIVQAWKEIGAAEQGILPARSAAYHALKGDSAPAAPGSAKKSSLPKGAKWIGFTVAGLVLIAFVPIFFPSGKKSHRESAGTPSAARSVPPASATSTTVPIASASPDRASIKLWDSPEKVTASYAHCSNGDLAINGGSLSWMEHPSRDAVIRAKARMNGDAQSQSFCLRSAAAGNSNRYVFLFSGPTRDTRALLVQSVTGREYTTLQSFPLPRAYGDNEWVQFEFKVVGDELTAAAEGKVFATVHDTSQRQAGGVQVSGWPAYFRDIEYVPLDPAGALVPATTAALQLWDSPEKIPNNAPKVTWEEGALKLDHGGVWTGQPMSVSGVLSLSMRADAQNQVRIMLRQGTDAAGAVFYSLRFRPADHAVDLLLAAHGRGQTIATWPLPTAYLEGKWVQVEYRAAGADISATIDGVLLGTVHDTTLPSAGPLSLSTDGVTYFRDIKYTPLEATD